MKIRLDKLLVDRGLAAGFAEVRWESLSLGIAAIHVGVKREAV